MLQFYLIFNQLFILFFCSDSINLLGVDPEYQIPDPCLPLNLKQNISIHFDVKNLINAQAKPIFKDHMMVYAIGTGKNHALKKYDQFALNTSYFWAGWTEGNFRWRPLCQIFK